MTERYDVIILGAGSAGMPAAIYTKRFGLHPLVIGKVVGGTLNDSHKVENWPGIPAIPGYDLMMRFKEHVDSLGIPVKEEEATNITKERDGTFTLTTDAATYHAKAIIFATGSQHRHLGLPGEEELAGRGVSYCATCDAAFFKNADVAIVGGGDAATQAAELLTQFATEVYILVRRDVMRAEPLNRQRLEQNPKVKILYNTKPVEVLGTDQVTGVKINRDGKEEVLHVQGLFVEAGADPRTELATRLGVTVNEQKEIMIDGASRTNQPRIYAAGDCADRKFKQAITGAAEGVIAAFSTYEDLKKAAGKKAEIADH